MPFTKEQKSDFISELQHYLYVLSYHEKKIPHIVSDGIYGRETKEAVRIFQKLHGLPTTGETDSRTWDEIVDEYKSCMRPTPLSVFCQGGILSTDSGEDIIYIVQVLLKKLARHFDNIPDIDVDGIYDDKTKECIACFMEHCGRDGEPFDEKAWNTLAAEYNAVRI